MERIFLVNCAVLCVSFLLLEVVLSAPTHDNTKYINCIKDENKKNGENYSCNLWFGARPGRRKRTPNGINDAYKASDIEREQELATLMDIIQDSPWAIVAVNEGKRHTVNFTPRLGRESGEEFLNGAPSGDQYLQDPELLGELLSQRSPPFAPRLGRRMSPYSPRLGRENDKN